MESPQDVTALLDDWARGDARARDRLLPLVYDELRRIAARQMRQERAGHTLQPTALVHEAYLKLVDQRRVDSVTVQNSTPAILLELWTKMRSGGRFVANSRQLKASAVLTSCPSTSPRKAPIRRIHGVDERQIAAFMPRERLARKGGARAETGHFCVNSRPARFAPSARIRIRSESNPDSVADATTWAKLRAIWSVASSAA